MMNVIMKAISSTLRAEFGDKYQILLGENKQDLQKPCFLVSCNSSTKSLFISKRYLRKNQFCIRYFPGEENEVEEGCYVIAERLFSCLEWIAIDEQLTMGTEMKCEIVDEVVQFFVNYDLFVYNTVDAPPIMEEVSLEASVKEDTER